MTNMWNIAVGMYKEMSRSKLFYVPVIFCLVLVVLTALDGTVSIGEDETVIRDSGIAAMEILGVLVAIFVASTTISKELGGRSIQVLLAKPVSKEEFILGKYFGTVLLVLLNAVLMSAGLFFVLLFKTRFFNFGLYRVVIPLCIEFVVMSGVAILCTVIVKGILGPIVSIVIFIVGHVTQLLPHMIKTASSMLTKAFVGIIYYGLPNLTYFNTKSMAVPGSHLPAPLMGGIILYGCLYAAMVLTVSMLVFRRKEVAAA